jgi:hypothetical protein
VACQSQQAFLTRAVESSPACTEELFRQNSTAGSSGNQKRFMPNHFHAREAAAALLKMAKQLPIPASRPDLCKPPPTSRSKLANWLFPQAPSPLMCSPELPAKLDPELGSIPNGTDGLLTPRSASPCNGPHRSSLGCTHFYGAISRRSVNLIILTGGL